MKNILKFNKFQNKMPSHKKKSTPPRKATHSEEFIDDSNILENGIAIEEVEISDSEDLDLGKINVCQNDVTTEGEANGDNLTLTARDISDHDDETLVDDHSNERIDAANHSNSLTTKSADLNLENHNQFMITGEKSLKSGDYKNEGRYDEQQAKEMEMKREEENDDMDFQDSDDTEELEVDESAKVKSEDENLKNVIDLTGDDIDSKENISNVSRVVCNRNAVDERKAKEYIGEFKCIQEDYDDEYKAINFKDIPNEDRVKYKDRLEKNKEKLKSMNLFFQRRPDLWTEGDRNSIRELKKAHINAIQRAWQSLKQ